MNPNFNRDQQTGETIYESSSMARHAVNVWRTYVMNSGFSKIHIIAHSAGGWCLESIQQVFGESFYNQVGKIAITDSCVISKMALNKG